MNQTVCRSIHSDLVAEGRHIGTKERQVVVVPNGPMRQLGANAAALVSAEARRAIGLKSSFRVAGHLDTIREAPLPPACVSRPGSPQPQLRHSCGREVRLGL